MIEILNKIISYSKKNKIYDGASFEDLKHLELKIGYMLPKGYEELYRTTNGGRLFNSDLLEIDEIINLLNDPIYIEKDDIDVIPNNYVKKIITYKKRLPLFKEKEKIIFIDFEVDESGISGQIVLYDGKFKVISNNLMEFFDKMLDNIDEIYKSDIFKYFENNTFLNVENIDNTTLKLENSKINVEIFNPQNNVIEKEIQNKKITKEILKYIAESFEVISKIFNTRIKNKVIIFDQNINHSAYNYFEYEDVYNQNSFVVPNIQEFLVKVYNMDLNVLNRMDIKLGYFYQIDDKNNKRYINVNHRLEISINRNSIKLKYIFNVKEPYIYNTFINIYNSFNALKEINDYIFKDETFEKLDSKLIDDLYQLFTTELAKYQFDRIDETKINYHADILNLFQNIQECNWIDPLYAESIMEIEAKNVKELTQDELKRYFSSIIKRETLESGYIAVLIDKGIFEKLVYRLKELKESNI